MPAKSLTQRRLDFGWAVQEKLSDNQVGLESSLLFWTLTSRLAKLIDHHCMLLCNLSRMPGKATVEIMWHTGTRPPRRLKHHEHFSG